MPHKMGYPSKYDDGNQGVNHNPERGQKTITVNKKPKASGAIDGHGGANVIGVSSMGTGKKSKSMGNPGHGKKKKMSGGY